MFTLRHVAWSSAVAILAADAGLIDPPKARDKIVFIKTHSTGSSTMTNLLHRYCDNYGKECYIPVQASRNCFEDCLEEVAKKAEGTQRHFDVWANHVKLVPEYLEVIVPGSVDISVFRKPFDRIMSSWAHGTVPDMQAALAKLKRNETVDDCGRTGMGMSEHVPLNTFGKLDFVMLTEQYNLGLVLLRRYLQWKLEDIVYVRMKDHSTMEEGTMAPFIDYLSQDDENLTETAVAFKEKCMRGDEAVIYEMAKAKWQEQYGSLSPEEKKDVRAELKLFEETLTKVQSCCETADADEYCKALSADNMQWVREHTPSFPSFLQRKRTGCVTLVPEV